jgi:hypothetical protein
VRQLLFAAAGNEHSEAQEPGTRWISTSNQIYICTCRAHCSCFRRLAQCLPANEAEVQVSCLVLRCSDDHGVGTAFMYNSRWQHAWITMWRLLQGAATWLGMPSLSTEFCCTNTGVVLYFRLPAQLRASDSTQCRAELQARTSCQGLALSDVLHQSSAAFLDVCCQLVTTLDPGGRPRAAASLFLETRHQHDGERHEDTETSPDHRLASELTYFSPHVRVRTSGLIGKMASGNSTGQSALAIAGAVAGAALIAWPAFIW